MNTLARGMKRAMRLSGRIAPVLIAAKLVACTVKAVRQNGNKKSRDCKVKVRTHPSVHSALDTLRDCCMMHLMPVAY